MTVESLDTAVVKCLERGRGIRMGIGRLYFYRSLYAVQLHNCFKVSVIVIVKSCIDRNLFDGKLSLQISIMLLIRCRGLCYLLLRPSSSSLFSSYLITSPHLKHIPREQFLIISTEQLRRDPVRTLNQVLQFTGLNLQFELGGVFNMLSPWNSRSHSFKSRNIRDQFSMEMMEGKWTEEISADEFHRQSAFIGAAVDKFFPTFGSSSGWQLHSAYSPLPSNLQAELTHFFKPYNNLLSKLLNTDYFDQEWADRGIGGGHNTSMVK